MEPANTGCLDFSIPLIILEVCQSLDVDQKIELFGSSKLQGEETSDRTGEQIKVIAEKTKASLTFSMNSAAMESVFKRQLSDIWSCDIESISIPKPLGNVQLASTSITVPDTRHLQSGNILLPAIQPVPNINIITNIATPNQSILVNPVEAKCIEKTELKNCHELQVKTDIEAFSLKIENTSPCSEGSENIDFDFSEHQPDDKMKPYECATCGKRFVRSVQLKRHMRIHTGEKPYTCATCSKCFADSSNFKKHMKVHASAEDRQKYRKVRKAKIQQTDNPHLCSVCGRQFSNAVRLKLHFRTHTGEKPYKCSACDRRYTRMDGLRRHLITHTGERPHACSTCGKTFIYPQELRLHQRRHTGEKPYECNDCGKKFVTSGHLTSHTRIHTGERPHECPICGKRCRESGNLQKHIRTHSKSKPYLCTTCGKGFRQRRSLEEHTYVHTGEKPHTCETCGQRFTHLDSYKLHLRIHTGENRYACSRCDLRFRVHYHLQRHMITHLGEKFYKCSTCEQGFNTPNALKVHMRQHTGERPYVCQTCSKTFMSSSMLSKHNNTHKKQAAKDELERNSASEILQSLDSVIMDRVVESAMKTDPEAPGTFIVTSLPDGSESFTMANVTEAPESYCLFLQPENMEGVN